MLQKDSINKTRLLFINLSKIDLFKFFIFTHIINLLVPELQKLAKY